MREPIETPVIEVDGLRHAFGDRHVLSDVSFKVQRGEIFGVLGPNGSGKSTLLGVLTGLTPRQRGVTRLDGVEMSPSSRTWRSTIGVVFQQPSLDGKLSVRENLRLVAMMHGLHGADRDAGIAEALRLSRLEDRATSVVGTLSGGMRRRLDIARALLPRPRILLMDEPTSGLDEASFRALWAHLTEANRATGVTIVVSTHRPDEAARCHRLCVLDRGVVATIATPEALCADLADDLIVLESPRPDALVERLREALSLDATRHGDEVHVGCADGHTLVPRVFEAVSPGDITAVAVRRPGLADAFLRLTGRQLDGDSSEAA